jgi:putative transposase
MRYMIIQDSLSNGLILPTSRACSALDVSKSGYYKWMNRCGDDASQSGAQLDLNNQIRDITQEFPGYGYRRVTVELRNRGYSTNHKHVLRIMREDNLLCSKKKFRPITTISDHGLPIYLNLTKDIEITGPNQVWASDITYIQLSSKWIYLAVILDLFSRKCIGWDLDRRIDADLAMNALNMALKNRWTESIDGLIHHSDQGVCHWRFKSGQLWRNKTVHLRVLLKLSPHRNIHPGYPESLEAPVPAAFCLSA